MERSDNMKTILTDSKGLDLVLDTATDNLKLVYCGHIVAIDGEILEDKLKELPMTWETNDTFHRYLDHIKACKRLLPHLAQNGVQLSEFFEKREKAMLLATQGSFDPVKKPKHYNSGKYEVIDMIESALSALPVLPFQAYCLGNALKYICRAGLKGDFSEDIRKAITYLNWAIGVDLRNEETRNTDSR